MGHSGPTLSGFLLLISLNLIFAQSPICSNTGTYSATSIYSKNLNQVLTSLRSYVTANGGFFNSSAGQDPDKVYSIGLCRGDLTSNSCYNCINTSVFEIQKQCPDQKEAIIWGEQNTCMIRYSNRYIFGTMEELPQLSVPNPNEISTNLDEFNRTLFKLMETLVVKASMGSSNLKFAVGDTEFNSSRNHVYALVQCTPDISGNDCGICLRGAVNGGISKCCGEKEGGRVFRPSCFAWFELFRFYDDTALGNPFPNFPPPPPSNTSTTENRKSNSRTVIIVAVIVPVVILSLIIVACAIFWKRRFKKNDYNYDKIESLKSLQYGLSIVRAATDNFSVANELGQGGFGSVYKGMLPNGQYVAVKRLNGRSTQGDHEFKNEILLMAKLQHRNLVTLIGFSLEGQEKLLLYEFVGNGSLDKILYDPIKRAQLKWVARFKIIHGIARGILYLHEDSRLKIIHRDIKPSNILLDEEMNPKISDFGLARLFLTDQSQDNTGRTAGTLGYMAPEYALHGQFSAKSDVFSFGVMVLELVSGKKSSWLRNSEEVEHLLSYAWRKWSQGAVLNLIDQTLGDDSTDGVIRCVHIGLLCVQDSVSDRPTMASVIQMLNNQSLTLPSPAEPAFFMDSSTKTSIPSLESNSQMIDLTSSTNTVGHETNTYFSAS